MARPAAGVVCAIADVGSWLLAGCGAIVIGIGVFFIAFRPSLLPKDRRYIGASASSVERVLPSLASWLDKVFWVMGGYMVATGLLTIYLALSAVRHGSTVAWVVAAVAGASSVGVMTVVNLPLRSDFRWALLGLAVAWTSGVALAALGI